MSSPQPRPMATPDLAALLAKRPPRRPQPLASESTVAVPDVAGAEASEAAAAGNGSSAPGAILSAVEDVSREAVQPTGTAPVRARNRKTAPVVAAPAPDAEAPSRQYKSPKQVYLPRSLHQRCLAVATERSTTMTALVLQAVNATHQRLDDVLRPDVDTASPGDLFAIPQANVPSEPSVQTTMRLTDQQLAVLDDLARRYQTKRSRLLAAALRLYLDEL